MATPGNRRSVLLGLGGLQIGGGIASVSRCIARALDEQVAAGRIDRVDRVLLLEDPANPAPPPRAGEQWLARGSQLRFVWQLWRAFMRQRHGLVLFDYLGLARAVTLPLPSFPPPEMVVFVHGVEIKTPPTGALGRALAHAHRLLVNSEFTAKELRRVLPAGDDRIRVTPLGLDPARVEAWEKLSANQLPAKRAPAALIVGRMWAEQRGKGHDALLAAWPSVRARIAEAELWIAGEGNDRPRLEQLARTLGVEQSVHFLGRVSDEQLGDLYRRASLFVMPSRQEGFGLVYAEAMWHGLPCIGTTADAAGDVIVDGETGLLVPYDDVAAIASAVATLLTDRDRAERMGRAGQRRAREQFSYARFRRDLLTALELD